MKSLIVASTFTLLIILRLTAGEAVQVVPHEKFQGLWEHQSSSKMIALEAGQDHGIWKKKGEKEGVYFRKHKSGSIQRVWKNDKGEVISSRGVTIISVNENTLKFREWSSHPNCYTEITIDQDGAMNLIEKTAKHVMKAQLVKPTIIKMQNKAQ